MKPLLKLKPITFSKISSEEDRLEDGIVLHHEESEEANHQPPEMVDSAVNSFEIEDTEDIEEQLEETIAVRRGVASPPHNYICPLTLRLMGDPVYDQCGHAFERTAILDWLEYHSMCPISRRPMDAADLVPSPDLQCRIHQWKEEHMAHFCEGPIAGGHLPFQSMLLPQEREVLEIIKARADDRRKLQQQRRFRMRVLVVSFFLLLLAVVLSVKYLGLDLTGSV
eukprot:scaffold25800_cov162-Cylindrotheca_fusiformis.AAC.5